jgi:hypothetical protein
MIKDVDSEFCLYFLINLLRHLMRINFVFAAKLPKFRKENAVVFK